MLDQINMILDILRQNPAILGLVIAVIRNIGGYAVECFNAKKLVQYEGMKLLETLTLYETFFITLGSIATLPIAYTAAATVAVDVIHSIKKVLASK